MKLRLLLTAITTTFAALTYGQEAEAPSPLEISGSADAYFKYDFAKKQNIQTSFASDQNSVSLGMLDLMLKKTTGKASFVGEISFGPRGQEQSLLNSSYAETEGGDLSASSFHIQNLYASYAFSDQFSMTAGFMGTFIGYEVISPAANFNYSTSYLFSAGPFQNAGIKGTYSFSDKVSLMAGLFNDWNAYTDFNGVSHFGAQLMVAPVEGWSAYLNFLTGKSAGATGAGTIFDLTTSYEVNENVKIGLNAADYSESNSGGGYSGAALYLQNSFTPGFALGLRGEYFSMKDQTNGYDALGVAMGESVTALTLSANLKAGGLTFIPEIRFDNGSAEMFAKENLTPTKSASQFSLAVVYAF